MFQRGHPYGGGASLARRGEGWHRRGYRDDFGCMAVNLAFSPRCGGSQTLEFPDHRAVSWLLKLAHDMLLADGIPEGVHCVLFHRKHELPVDGESTAADFGMESGDTLYLKCYDKRGNQLRWEPLMWYNHDAPEQFVPCKENHVIDEEGFAILEALFEQGDPWAVTTTADVPAAWARQVRVSKTVVAEWFAYRRAVTGEEERADKRDRWAHHAFLSFPLFFRQIVFAFFYNLYHTTYHIYMVSRALFHITHLGLTRKNKNRRTRKLMCKRLWAVE